MVARLDFSCPGFFEGGDFPIDNTGRGADLSPEFNLKNLSSKAQSLAITLEDLSYPLKPLPHWIIWNLPASSRIPAGIAKGFEVARFSQARQGIAYGWHLYAGPKPPIGQTHRYRFTVYALDTTLDLGKWTGRSQLVKAMQGHILQKGELTAYFGNNKLWEPLPDLPDFI